MTTVKSDGRDDDEHAEARSMLKMRPVDFSGIELVDVTVEHFHDGIDTECRKRISALTHSDVVERRLTDIERACGDGQWLRLGVRYELIARIRELCPESQTVADAIVEPSTRAAGLERAHGLSPIVLLCVWWDVCDRDTTPFKTAAQAMHRELGRRVTSAVAE